ncbi:MAG: hypothetical protein NDJ89_02595 [Oligoflexia bacterium]|nr:hypothetical protein [Oligoflexia bacterium]
MAIEAQTNIHEGKMTRNLEERTARIPSLGYLSFAMGSMAISASLALIFKRRDWANFVGLWVPSILIMGLYNKVVKLQHENMEGGVARQQLNRAV